MGFGPWLPASPSGRMNFGEFLFYVVAEMLKGGGAAVLKC
jgi:hypothetical protein